MPEPAAPPTPVPDAFALLCDAAPPDFFAQLRHKLGLGPCDGETFSAALTCWLMVWQYLDGPAALTAALAELGTGRAAALATTATRLRQGTVSAATGTYGRARTRLPTALAEHLADQLFAHRRAVVADAATPPTFLLDGTTLRTPASASLTAAYPPAHNQHGASHWPLLRVVVAHELTSGLAVRPATGPTTASEQALSVGVLDRLPAASTVVADRNFGVFAVAWACHQRALGPLVRLKADRARRVVAGAAALDTDGEHAARWRPSREDQPLAGAAWPGDVALAGRVVVRHVGRGAKREQVLLFTTDRTTDADALLALYGRRWDVETDLRTLKSQLGLEQLRSQSPVMAHKELVLAVTAYNLIRAVMALAARAAGLSPRQLSYTGTQGLVRAFGPLLAATADAAERARRTAQLLRMIAQRKLPQRAGRAAPPRAAYGRPKSYPTPQSLPRKTEREAAAAM